MTTFDLESYLIERDFTKSGNHYICLDPKVKVKMLNDRIAVTSPDRRFKKIEANIPKTNIEANKVFDSILSNEITIDSRAFIDDGVHVTRGTVISVSDYEKIRLIKFKVNGSGEQPVFIQPTNLLDVEIKPGEKLAIGFKIKYRNGNNILAITGIYK